MSNTRINLLPLSQRRRATYEYLIRLCVVVLALVTVLTGIAILLLVPTQFFLSRSLQTRQAQLATNEPTTLPQGADTSARLKTLSTNAGLILALKNISPVSPIIRDALAVSSAGIALINANYTRGTSPKPNTLVVAGVASTRDTLYRYLLAMQSAPFAMAATLPVSAYAKDTNIPFAITVTLAP